MPELHFVPQDVITIPRNRHVVLTEAWWATNENGDVALYYMRPGGVPSPQCNTNRDIAERVGQRVLGERYRGVVHLPVAFVPHQCA